MQDRTKKFRYSGIVAWLALFSLVVGMFTGVVSGDVVSAKDQESKSARETRKSAGRVSPDVREREKRSKKSGVNETVKIILQVTGPLTGRLNSLLQREGVRVKGHFQQFNSYAVELPVSVVAELETFSEVLYVSMDKEMQPLGHLSLTTGADAVRTQTTSSTSTTRVDGSGVAIAVLDSGIYQQHVSFLGATGVTRVIVNKDFTGENRVDDPYGHGTHVASIAAGNGRVAEGAYRGVAPGANLINLRVLNTLGNGSVSSVMAALDWVMAKRQYSNCG